jgi:hypothetical protein
MIFCLAKILELVKYINTFLAFTESQQRRWQDPEMQLCTIYSWYR